MFLFFSKLLGNFRICTSLMLLMKIVLLAQCCLIFWKNTSLLLNFFQKKTSWKIVAYKPLLIKHNECMFIFASVTFNRQIVRRKLYRLKSFLDPTERYVSKTIILSLLKPSTNIPQVFRTGFQINNPKRKSKVETY